MSNFRVGQKVVCVDDKPWRGPMTGDAVEWPTKIIQRGSVYTIRESSVSHPRSPVPCVRLVEARWNDSYDAPFAAVRFRPVVERKTDISIFQKMLDGTRVLETTVSSAYRANEP